MSAQSAETVQQSSDRQGVAVAWRNWAKGGNARQGHGKELICDELQRMGMDGEDRRAGD